MRRVLIAFFAGVLMVGCGHKFADEATEQAYLQSLSNPTPEQFERRKELVKKAEDAAIKDEATEQDRADSAERKAECVKYAKNWIAAGAYFEKKKEWKLAWERYDYLCKECPDIDEAKIATERRNFCLDQMSK